VLIVCSLFSCLLGPANEFEESKPGGETEVQVSMLFKIAIMFICLHSLNESYLQVRLNRNHPQLVGVTSLDVLYPPQPLKTGKL